MHPPEAQGKRVKIPLRGAALLWLVMELHWPAPAGVTLLSRALWFRPPPCAVVLGGASPAHMQVREASTGPAFRGPPWVGPWWEICKCPWSGFKALSNWKNVKIIIINWHPDKWHDCLIGVVARELGLTWKQKGKRHRAGRSWAVGLQTQQFVGREAALTAAGVYWAAARCKLLMQYQFGAFS